MRVYDLVVIGGGGAGVIAANEGLKYNPKSRVLVISDEKYLAYPRCDLPFLICEKEERIRKILSASTVYEKQAKMHIIKNTRATCVDTKKKTVTARDLKDNAEREYRYNSLVIATGGKVFIPPIEGVESKRVFALRTLDDMLKIREHIKKVKNCVIIGAGAIGIELSEIFVRHGIATTIVEMLPQVLPRILDPDMASVLEKILKENGIEVITGKPVTSINSRGGVVESVSTPDKEIPAEMVLLVTGVRPNVELVKGTDIELGATGGIKTNSKMETNVANVYATGDCAENIHFLTKKPFLGMLASNAIKQGKIAGINAVGGDLHYNGIVNPMVLEVFGVEIGAVGLSESEAARNNFSCITGRISLHERAIHTEFERKNIVKMIADSGGRILGSQIIGERVPPKIDTITVGLYNQLRVDELMLYETSYAPILTNAINPLTMVSEVIHKKIERMKKIS